MARGCSRPRASGLRSPPGAARKPGSGFTEKRRGSERREAENAALFHRPLYFCLKIQSWSSAERRSGVGIVGRCAVGGCGEPLPRCSALRARRSPFSIVFPPKKPGSGRRGGCWCRCQACRAAWELPSSAEPASRARVTTPSHHAVASRRRVTLPSLPAPGASQTLPAAGATPRSPQPDPKALPQCVWGLFLLFLFFLVILLFFIYFWGVFGWNRGSPVSAEQPPSLPDGNIV